MNENPVVDAVQARLAQQRGERKAYAEVDGEGRQASEPYRIGLSDLDGIAQRHYERGAKDGQLAGYRMGYDTGHTRGRNAQRAQARETLHAICSVLEERLERIPARLAAPEKGKERRTKDELRAEALDLIVDVRASIIVLLVAAADGTFDAPEAG